MFYFVRECDNEGNKIDYSNYTEEQLKQLVEPLRRWNRETIEKPRIIWSKSSIIAPVLEDDNTWTIYFNYKEHREDYDEDDDDEEYELYYSHADMMSDDEYTLDGWIVLNPHKEEIILSRPNYSEKVPEYDIEGCVTDDGILCFNLCATYVENIEYHSAQKLREAIINNYKAIKVLEDCRTAYDRTAGFCDYDFSYSKQKFIFSVSSKETPVDPNKFLYHFKLDEHQTQEDNTPNKQTNNITAKIVLPELPFSYSEVVVCFTGIRDGDLEEAIKQKGGKVVSSITKACNYLIYGSDDSVKYKQAKEKKIFIEHYADAKNRFLGN